ncbi:hypothetical protein [Nocardia carnea]|uniref:hypothetical protein n=1 Tax=Nocardia carnea TaxID=37328 RepID=UPI0024559F58|nr:hypothetical protein [Nocardia carnea]
MPKNSSARRRRRTLRIAEEEGVRKYTVALRRGDERTHRVRADEQAEHQAHLWPVKVEIDGVLRYVRRADAEQLGPDGLADPTGHDVVAAADMLLPQVRSLLTARLRLVTVTGPDGRPQRIVPCEAEHREQFRSTVTAVLGELKRVREDADIAWVEWSTVATAFYGVNFPLSGLRRITTGPLNDRVEEAIRAAEILSTTAEAVHNRGCLLGAGENRSRRMHGHSPCSGGDLRVRIRIYDDDTIVTDPGCPRHAAEEIVHWDTDVEAGYAGVEIMGGIDQDLDMIYDLATEVRRERRRIRRERDRHKADSYLLPSPPWMKGYDN